MSDKIKMADINADGYIDRIGYDCEVSERELNSCFATQVEFGLEGGEFLPLFDAESIEENAPIEAGDEIISSPTSILRSVLNGYSDMEPGLEEIDAFAGDETDGRKPLSTDEIIDLCRERAPGDYDCEAMAISGPEDHIYQPRDIRRYFSDEIVELCRERIEDGAKQDSCIEEAKHAPDRHVFQPMSLRHRSMDELIAICREVEPTRGMVSACIKAAKEDPTGHRHQRDVIPAGMLRCKSGVVRARDVITHPDALLHRPHELYAPIHLDRDTEQGHHLRANVIARAQAGTSNDVREYVYAYFERAIDDAALASRLAERWMSITPADLAFDRKTVKKLAQHPDPKERARFVATYTKFDPSTLILALSKKHETLAQAIMGTEAFPSEENGYPLLITTQARADALILSGIAELDTFRRRSAFRQLARNEIKRRLIIDRYAEKHPIDFAVWATNFLGEPESNAVAITDNQTVRRHTHLRLAAIVQDPKFTDALFAAFHERFIGDIDAFRMKGTGQRKRLSTAELNLYANLITMAQKAPQIPNAETLMTIGDNDVRTIPIVLFALAKKGERTKAIQAFVCRHLRPPIGTIENVPMLASAQLLEPSDAVDRLQPFLDSPEPLVRLNTYGMLIAIPKQDEALSALIANGVSDSDLRIQAMTANALFERGDARVAKRLFNEVLAPYAARTPSHAPFRSSIFDPVLRQRDLIHAQKINTPIIKDPNASEETAPTLKQFALFAIARFGQPQEAIDAVIELLETETDDIDLTLSAQALIALEGITGLERVLDQIDARAAPGDLIRMASGAAVQLNATHLAPRLFPHLQHKESDVRNTVAQNLHALDGERILAALLEHSTNKNARKRRHYAEALGAFDGPESTARLIEMLDDRSRRVRYAAGGALKRISDPKAIEMINAYVEANPKKARYLRAHSRRTAKR